MPKLIARWNPARDVWETETTGLFCEHSDVFSATWPASGMTRAGVAYELPASAHPTDDSASSSLLQTPSVADALGGHLTRGGERSDELLLPGQVQALLPMPRTSDTNGAGMHGDGGMDLRTAVDLLPTPMARDYKGCGPADAERHDPNLSAISMLLPTPRATDGTKGGPNRRGSSGDLMLPSAVQALLPTSTVGDSKSARNSTATRHKIPPTGIHAGDTLTDILVPLGASTNPPSDGGNEC